MAAYSGNGDFFALDGVDLSPHLYSINAGIRNQPFTSTAGSDTSEGLIPGLDRYFFTVTLGYDDQREKLILPVTRPGLHFMHWGKRGTSPGCPRHMQQVYIEENPIQGGMNLSALHLITITMMGAGMPAYDQWNGDTF